MSELRTVLPTELRVVLCKTDIPGFYNIRKDGMAVSLGGTEYAYISSGLCREVFRSGRDVVKLPVFEVYDNPDVTVDVSELAWHTIPWPAMHNICEANCYKQCPDDLKPFFAKTELVDYCWVKQEFVEVVPYYHSAYLREVGYREVDGKWHICLFDYDMMFPVTLNPDHNTTWTRGEYEYCVEILKKIDIDLRASGKLWFI